MEIFKAIAETNHWYIIGPEICLGLLAILILMVDCFFPKKGPSAAPGIAMLGQAIILALGIFLFKPSEGEYFSGLVQIGPMSQVMRIFFLISGILVCYLANIYFSKQKLPRCEFYALVLITTAALMLLVESSHFLMLFVALETVTVGLLILVAYCKTSVFSLEAGIKYLILAALSSSLLLFGIVILYGVGGNFSLPEFSNDSMNFTAFGHFLEVNPENLLAKLGIILVICGLAFKIGAFPFQIWIPDVYQGAPTPVTAFLAVSSKAAGIVVLMNLFNGPFMAMRSFFIPLLSAIAIVTIFFGNISAISQTNVKRLMGLSGISHAGYLLLGVVASFTIQWANSAIIFYLFTYLLGSFAVFFVMEHMAGSHDEDQNLYDYEGFSKINPFLGTALLVGIGSLAGIPPFVGFIGKLLLFIAAFEAKLYFLLGVAILGVVISIYYYFAWIREAFFFIWKGSTQEEKAIYDNKPPKTILLKFLDRIILGIIIIFTLILGFYQGAMGGLIF